MKIIIGIVLMIWGVTLGICLKPYLGDLSLVIDFSLCFFGGALITKGLMK